MCTVEGRIVKSTRGHAACSGDHANAVHHTGLCTTEVCAPQRAAPSWLPGPAGRTWRPWPAPACAAWTSSGRQPGARCALLLLARSVCSTAPSLPRWHARHLHRLADRQAGAEVGTPHPHPTCACQGSPGHPRLLPFALNPTPPPPHPHPPLAPQRTLYPRGPLDVVEDMQYPVPPNDTWWAQHARHFYPPQRRASSTAFIQVRWQGRQRGLPRCCSCRCCSVRPLASVRPAHHHCHYQIAPNSAIFLPFSLHARLPAAGA